MKRFLYFDKCSPYIATKINILVSTDLEKQGFDISVYYIHRYYILDTYIDTI